MAEELTTAIEETSPIETDITETTVEPSVDYSANEVALTSIETPDNIDDLYNDFIKPNNYFSSSDEFRTFISDPKNAKDFFKDAIAPEKLFSNEKEFIQFLGVQQPGKPSAVPSASVGGGSATKGRGVEQPSMSPQLSSEASLDNIQQTMKVYADGQGAFPETLSAADVKELRKQVPGGELPNISDEKVAKMLAGKSPKQVRIESVNAIPDIKERKTEQARMYLDWAKEKGNENRQLDQNITILKQGLAQIKSEGENLQQQLQNPNIDPQTASMLSDQLQQTQANYNQAANDYNNELNKYQQNARFIKTMGAGGLSSLKGMLPSSMWQPRSPSDVMAASAFNSTAPALLKTLGAVVDIFPAMVYGEDTKDSNSPVADALFNIADKITIDIGKYSPQANVSLMDDVNAANASQLFGSLLGSVAMTFGGGAVAGATGAQAAGFSQVYGDVYKQGRDAGLTQAESMYFALPTGLVAAYLGDKGVESLAGVFSKTSLKSAIKQGMKEMAEKKTPQMMMELGQKVLTNTVKGGVKEGLQEGTEFVTEFGSKKGASLKEGVKFQDDLSLEGFKKGLTESVIGGAAGGGLLGPFFGAGRNKAFSDVVNKAARDPQAEADFMEQVNASVAANDITQEQKQQIVDMLEKTKQAAATVPPVVESEPARAEATALVLEQQDLQEQIDQTNPAMAKPLNDRLDEVNNRLGEIAEGKNLPTEEEAIVSETPTTETQKEEAAPVAEEAKPQEKGEFSIQGTFRGLTQVLGDPANMIPDIVRADIEPKFSESNQNGKKFFTLTVPQLDNGGRAGYLAVSLVLPETTTKTIDDVKSALQEKVSEAQAAVELSREKGFPLETVFKNKVGAEYTEQPTPATEAQAPVAEEAKEEARAEVVNSNADYDRINKELIKKRGDAINKRNKLKQGTSEYNLAQKEVEKSDNDLNDFQSKNTDLILEHGTPHDFSKFELEKIGTGEGNQAFGHGLYFTENSKIAKAYAEKLSKDKEGIVYQVRIKNGRLNDWLEWRDALDDTQAEKISNVVKSKKADYDKYLSETKNDETHTGAAEQLFNDNLSVDERSLQAGAVYADLRDAFGSQEATKIMQEAGIDGVKYKTRGGKGNDFNYVVFNPESIVIENKQPLSTQEAQTPTSEQAPESFPAQEGAASEQEKEFKAHPELEQVYRDLHAAVTKNLDPKTLEAVKRNPTLVMVEKALRELERKGVIKIEC